MILHQPIVFHDSLAEPFYCSEVYSDYDKASSHGRDVAVRMGLNLGDSTIICKTIFVRNEG